MTHKYDQPFTRSTPDTRKPKYIHVSVAVGVEQDPETRMLIPQRTPKGEGSTARRATPKRARFGQVKSVGHDWPGAYLGKLASIETAQRLRRAAKAKARRDVPRQKLLKEALPE